MEYMCHRCCKIKLLTTQVQKNKPLNHRRLLMTSEQVHIGRPMFSARKVSSLHCNPQICRNASVCLLIPLCKPTLLDCPTARMGVPHMP